MLAMGIIADMSGLAASVSLGYEHGFYSACHLTEHEAARASTNLRLHQTIAATIPISTTVTNTMSSQPTMHTPTALQVLV